MRSVVEIGASVPAFLGKLWKLVNDSETNHLISWSINGKTFVIKNQADFARDLLPLYYKHNNMASFIRQLNMYGFHKITSVENGGLRYDKDEIEFSHPCFMRGHAYLLEHIKRKIANPKAVITSSDTGEKALFKPEVMSKVLADVKQMKGKQESLDAKFSAMKQENEALWREVAILRQKHIKQQQIVNNLIQFLMSLVQPSRSGNPNPNGVGVKRPYQLMINSAAHNSSNDQTYSQIKNLKLDKDAGLGDDLNDDNVEDGPTIHELAHDDNLQNELSSPDNLNSSEFVTVQINTPPYGNVSTTHSPNNVGSQVYHVTLEDGDELETDHTGEPNIVNQKTGTRPRKNTLETQPQMASPSAKLENSLSQFNVATKKIAVPSTSKTKANRYTQSKSLLSPSNFNVITPSTDFKLPAEIFASDDSVSDAGTVVPDDTVAQILETTTSSMPMLAVDPSLVSSAKDKMLGGINIKVEKLQEPTPAPQKKTKSKHKDNHTTLNLQDIKTELQDDLDWNMSLAPVNNYSDVNKFQAMNRDDYYSKNCDGFSSHLGTNMPKTDIDDHLDTMQTDLESLRELLRSDSYSLDANTLLGLFGSDDPLYGLSYNPVDDRSKNSNSVKKQKGDMSDGRVERAGSRGLSTANDADATNQLISYTGNIPDFEDISMPDLDGEDSQDVALSPLLSESTLNTPQVVLKIPNYSDKP